MHKRIRHRGHTVAVDDRGTLPVLPNQPRVPDFSSPLNHGAPCQVRSVPESMKEIIMLPNDLQDQVITYAPQPVQRRPYKQPPLLADGRSNLT